MIKWNSHDLSFSFFPPFCLLRPIKNIECVDRSKRTEEFVDLVAHLARVMADGKHRFGHARLQIVRRGLLVRLKNADKQERKREERKKERERKVKFKKVQIKKIREREKPTNHESNPNRRRYLMHLGQQLRVRALRQPQLLVHHAQNTGGSLLNHIETGLVVDKGDGGDAQALLQVLLLLHLENLAIEVLLQLLVGCHQSKRNQKEESKNGIRLEMK